MFSMPITEQMLAIRVARSQQSVDFLIDEVLLNDDEDAPKSLREAFNDLMGFDTDYAQKLLDADAEARARAAALEEERQKETPEQRRRRLLRERRCKTRRELRDELLRENPGTVRRLQMILYTLSMPRLREAMRERGLVFKPWQVIVLLVMFVAMITSNYSAYASSSAVSRPTHYTAICRNCKHTYKIECRDYDRFIFHKTHTSEEYHAQYGNEEAKPSVCPNCHIVQTELVLATCPEDGKIFVIADTAAFKLPKNAQEIRQYCPFHEKKK